MKPTAILVIDSDSKNLQILRESLESYDFMITTVDNGIDAWGIISSQRPDMIICEVDIAGLTGFELHERLQKNGSLAAIPIVFLTNRRNLEDRLRSLRSGVKDYMVKPLHVKEVIARIQMILRRIERIKSESDDAVRKETGELEKKSVEDLIETYGTDRRTGILSVYDDTNRQGEIYFRDGMVVNALLDNFRAEKAVYQMLPWKHGRYSMTFKEISIDEEITVSNLGLLLQGFKHLQDRETLIEKIGSLQTVFVKTAIFEKVLQRKTVSTDANRFISLFDGKRSVAEVVSESIYDDIKTLEKTVRLFQQGFIEPLDVRSVPHMRPAASDADPASTAEQRPKTEQSYPLPSFDLEPEPLTKSATKTYSQPAASELEPDTEYDIREPSILEELEEAPVDNSDVVNINHEKASPPEVFQPPTPPTIEDASHSENTKEPETTPINIEDKNDRPVKKANPLALYFDALFNGETSGAGYVAIVASDEGHRKQLISTLTAGQYSVKPIGHDGSKSTEIGRIVTPSQNTVEIIGVASDKRMLNTLSQISSEMLGYVVLIAADRGNLGYWGYLLNSLKKKFQAPRAIAIYSTDEDKNISLNNIQNSLRCAEDERILRLQIANPDSVQHLLEELRGHEKSPSQSPVN